MENNKVRVVGVPIQTQIQTPINFMDGLALLLIGLKLTDKLDNWTWIEILAPLWLPYMLSWFVRLVHMTFFAPTEEEGE